MDVPLRVGLKHYKSVRSQYFDCLLTPAGDMATFMSLLEADAKTRCVLLLDNFHEWLEKWDRSELFRLRAYLFEPGAPIVIASGRSLPVQLSAYEEPFYDAFSLFTLESLTFEQCFRLLGELRKGYNLPAIPQSEQTKVDGLFKETSYTPGICLLLSILPDYGKSHEELLHQALMPLTSYYTSLLENMTMAQRKTWMALLKSEVPLLLTELRELSGQSGSELTPQLHAFLKKGLINQQKISPKKTLYALSDCTIRAWYKYCAENC